MIDPTFTELSVRRQCEILNLNRSSYYYEPESRLEEQCLMNRIYELWRKYPFYGYRKVHAVLVREGERVNRKIVQRIMKEMELQAIYPKCNMSAPSKGHLIYPYLLTGIEVVQVNQLWVTDITYIKMPVGFTYFIAIMDVHSRFIVGYQLSISLEVDFCVESLQVALDNYGAPEIFNTDQGSQFTSKSWLQILLKHNVRISMDGKGRCFDNIYAERFWRTLKYEDVHIKAYETVSEARESLAAFVKFYNFERPHQSLNYKVPADLYFARGARIGPCYTQGPQPWWPANCEAPHGCGLVHNTTAKHCAK